MTLEEFLHQPAEEMLLFQPGGRHVALPPRGRIGFVAVPPAGWIADVGVPPAGKLRVGNPPARKIRVGDPPAG